MTPRVDVYSHSEVPQIRKLVQWCFIRKKWKRRCLTPTVGCESQLDPSDEASSVQHLWITATSLFLLSDTDANALERCAAVPPQRSQPQERQSKTRETRWEPASGAAALMETCEDTAAVRERRRNCVSPEHQKICTISHPRWERLWFQTGHGSLQCL